MESRGPDRVDVPDAVGGDLAGRSDTILCYSKL